MNQPPIPPAIERNFDALRHAVGVEKAGVLSVIDKRTGKPAFLVVTIYPHGGKYDLVPIARMLDAANDGDPMVNYLPPDGAVVVERN